jgi:hypothetical protein
LGAAWLSSWASSGTFAVIGVVLSIAAVGPLSARKIQIAGATKTTRKYCRYLRAMDLPPLTVDL